MKKFFLSLCVVFALFGFAHVANADFVTGLIIGSTFGGGSRSGGGGESNVLYVLPRAAERIKDPLQMKTKVANVSALNGCLPQYNTLAENFSGAVDNSGNYEVLQVLRVGRPDSNSCFVYWFTYIEKSQVTPIEQLPQLKTAQ